jgi:hypothetical protein
LFDLSLGLPSPLLLLLEYSLGLSLDVFRWSLEPLLLERVSPPEKYFLGQSSNSEESLEFLLVDLICCSLTVRVLLGPFLLAVPDLSRSAVLSVPLDVE